MNTYDMTERAGLQGDRASHACAQAVATGDFGAAVDWAVEYETVCAKLAALADSAPTGGGER